MNEKFFELPQEKQLRIINAGFEVFSKYEYKKASTEEIAIKAGISKGLLFHYFNNKKSLYMYLLNYSMNLIKEQMVNSEFEQITDFFELLEYTVSLKANILERTPYIMEFSMRAFYSQNETISEDLQEKMQRETDQIFETYFKHINFNKFKEEVNPQDIYRMLLWMTDGFLHEIQRSGAVINVKDIMNEYDKWKVMLKQISYKEEFKNECNGD